MSRAWIKLWVEEELTGRWRFKLTPAERSVWTDLRLLAGRSVQDGVIVGAQVGAQLGYLKGTLNVSRKVLESALHKLRDMGEIEDTNDGIRIVNWRRWQSEYGRQKPYRQAKKLSDDPDKYVKGKYGHMVQR